MTEITDRMLTMAGRKFPTRNVIKGTGKIPVGEVIKRVIDKHNVTLVLGRHNVTVIEVTPIEEE